MGGRGSARLSSDQRMRPDPNHGNEGLRTRPVELSLQYNSLDELDAPVFHAPDFLRCGAFDLRTGRALFFA
jgi:hypothetical protein